MRTKPDCINQLQAVGISYDDAVSLRRISMTLHRWHELECGIDGGIGTQSTMSVERDGEEDDSPPFLRVQYPTKQGYVDRRSPIPDRERGALKRLARIMARYPSFGYYVQGDPRGCALYILRPDDLPPAGVTESYRGEWISAHYTRGIAVYK